MLLVLVPGSFSQEWPYFGGDAGGTRYSPLEQINRRNVDELRVAWEFDTQEFSDGTKYPSRSAFEATPIVIDSVLYVTSPFAHLFALDADTGEQLWHFDPKLDRTMRLNLFVNRGVSYWGRDRDKRIFLGDQQGRLFSIDAASGQLDAGFGDAGMLDLARDLAFESGNGRYGLTSPVAVCGEVIVAGGWVSDGEPFGPSGDLRGLDVRTGRELWRFHTVPRPGEFGHDTWAGDSWKSGGASIWITPPYDPELNLVYWGVGNPGPDWNGDVRLGDNLFSDSVVALDADTGERKWHFQFTPHDVHDWDATQVMVLMDKEYRGSLRKLLVTANRNGFIYMLDRETGEFLKATQFVKQTWAVGISEEGRPIRRPGMEPSAQGTEVFPTVAGGTNWMSPTYSPDTGLLYVSCREGSSMYFKGETEYRPGTRYWGSMFVNEPTMHNWYGAVRAFDPVSAELQWEHRLYQPAWAGLISTAGGLVFAGTSDGFFKALDAGSGNELWRINLGAGIQASPMAFESEGRQMMAVAAGGGLFVFALPE